MYAISLLASLEDNGFVSSASLVVYVVQCSSDYNSDAFCECKITHVLVVWQTKLSMAESQEQSRDGGGFETWGTSKRVTRKGSTAQKKVEVVGGRSRAQTSSGKPVSSLHLSMDTQRMKQTREEELRKRKGKSIREKQVAEEGTILISQKEYEVLQNVKKSGSAAAEKIGNGDCNAPSLVVSCFQSSIHTVCVTFQK